MTKKKETIAASEIQSEFAQVSSSNFADTFIDKLDNEKISRLEKELNDLKEKNSKKLYAVKMDSELLSNLIDFISKDSEWNQTEALGIIEIHKTLTDIQKEGVKDKTIFLNALPLEATHYFLSKTKGRGLKEAQSFISLYKPFAIALEEIKTDASEVQGLEKELSAAQQGIETA